MQQPAALYARVSSTQQRENHTIASQTAALLQYAAKNGYSVPPEWQFQDEGYSGASLLRPGLEAIRDLAAAGSISAVLVYSPDRLSRKYAYQVVLAEEFSRCGVALVFLQAPNGDTPEDHLLVQFQGMIAEYERAQIAERTRRGKRHRAQQGCVSVLCGAPYGYRYVKKSEGATPYYAVVDKEAEVVRQIFAAYTEEGLGLKAIVRRLNEDHVPTRTGARWERSTVWGMLRNPAYQGKACFNKTQRSPRHRITRKLRQRGGSIPRHNAHQERPRQDWIEIAVPALISEETFALAQEQLEKNKQYASRRTRVPTLLQGILVCQHCGYAFYRYGKRTPTRTTYYYRCSGSDAHRHLCQPVCSNRPIRQDFLDPLIWQELMRLLEDPTLMQTEIQRRREEAQKADPLRQRQEALQRERTRLQNHIDRLLTAYQEELISLEQLRQRTPELRRQQQAVQLELQSLQMAAEDPSRYLRVVETLDQFRNRLRTQAEKLDVVERQKILRLLVKEILVGKDTILIRHSIPLSHATPESSGPLPTPQQSEPLDDQGYLLRTGSDHSSLRDFFQWTSIPANVEARGDGAPHRL
jgi:site-specific DNA recombinase